jgi:hypothetical protein
MTPANQCTVVEIHVEGIEFCRHRGGPWQRGVAVLASLVAIRSGPELAFLTVSYVDHGELLTITLAALRLTSGSYQRVCAAIGIEP